MIKKFEFPDIRVLNQGRRHFKVSGMDFFFFLYIGAETLLSKGLSVEQVEEYIRKKVSSGYLERSGIYILLDSNKKSKIERELTYQHLIHLSKSIPHVAKKMEKRVFFP